MLSLPMLCCPNTLDNLQKIESHWFGVLVAGKWPGYGEGIPTASSHDRMADSGEKTERENACVVEEANSIFFFFFYDEPTLDQFRSAKSPKDPQQKI